MSYPATKPELLSSREGIFGETIPSLWIIFLVGLLVGGFVCLRGFSFGIFFFF